MAERNFTRRTARFEDLSGMKFGRLSVLELIPHEKGKHPHWRCMCECGQFVIVRSSPLRNGNNRSCGCLRAETEKSCNKTHGHSSEGNRTPEYRTWKGMIARCENKNRNDYEDYGGRGIKVCQRWRESFENFLTDMGPRPSKRHSIDRFPNNDGDYEPSNTRWATPIQQAANRRKRRRHAKIR